jgi:predicted alpha/beta-fold hydrolase
MELPSPKILGSSEGSLLSEMDWSLARGAPTPASVVSDRSVAGLSRPSLPCRAPWWADTGHLQTIFGNFLPEPALNLPSVPLEIGLEDGDRLAGRVFGGSRPERLCIFHGLGGDDDRPYMRRAIRMGVSRGLEVWTVNHRGCGRGRGLAKGTYHCGVAGDLGAVFAEARSRGDGAVIALAFSLSGNALLLNLGEGYDGPHPKPDRAMVVNPPVNLGRCSHLLGKAYNRPYDYYFVRHVLSSVWEREEAGLIPKGRYLLGRMMTLRAFDDAYTAPAGGFIDGRDYYDRCSASAHLCKITTPTVILHSEDDPFVDARDLKQARLGPAVHLHMEPRGGHMGYVSLDLPDRRWLSYALGHYLDELLAL